VQLAKKGEIYIKINKFFLDCALEMINLCEEDENCVMTTQYNRAEALRRRITASREEMEKNEKENGNIAILPDGKERFRGFIIGMNFNLIKKSKI
jgi:hypothetical protein